MNRRQALRILTSLADGRDPETGVVLPRVASMAYVLLSALRRIALAGTRLARATCGSIRLKLLKIGAQVRLSARRIRIAMASACPHADTFAHAHARLCT